MMQKTASITYVLVISNILFSGIELTNFKRSGNKSKCSRRQGPLQTRKFWGFAKRFCHIFFGISRSNKNDEIVVSNL